MSASAVDKAIEYSRQTVGVAWAAVSRHVGGGALLSTEGMSDEIAAFLDTTVSIDGIYRVKNGAYKGLAYRSQPVWPGRPFCTHTVRWQLRSGNRTERHKLIAAHEEDGAIGPALHMHAYFSNTSPTTDLICVAAVPTKQLVRLMLESPECFRPRPVYDGNTLGYVTWDCMIERGLDVVVCDASGNALDPDAWPDSWQNNPKSRLLRAAILDLWNKEDPF